MKRIEKFQTLEGKEPFQEWIDEVDSFVQAKIYAYIDRVALGAAKKNIKSLGDGIFEIKITYGSGYRVYFGQAGLKIVLLLLGGDKGSQKRDIIKAKEYWRIYEQS